MKSTSLNALFVVLLLITLILFNFNFTLESVESEKNILESNMVTGEMQTFEVSSWNIHNYDPTKKNTRRYNEKLFAYLEHIQESRDTTFHKGKVFLKGK
jgi:hypothetical protein